MGTALCDKGGVEYGDAGLFHQEVKELMKQVDHGKLPAELPADGFLTVAAVSGEGSEVVSQGQADPSFNNPDQELADRPGDGGKVLDGGKDAAQCARYGSRIE